jgi:energy-coupling factor transport system permease protein
MPDLSTALSYRRPALTLDVRTALLALLIVNIVCLSGGFAGTALWARLVASAIPLALLATARRWVPALVCLLAFGVAFYTQTAGVDWLAARTSTSVGAHVVTAVLFLVGTVLNLAARALPSMLMAWYVITTTRVSALMAGLARLRVPQVLIIPLAVVLRMVPVLASESGAIGDSARSRGLRVGLSKPSALVAYRVVPLTLRTIDIGDELTQAALTRGLDATGTRTHIAPIGFGWGDAVVLVACALVIVLSVLGW